MKRTVLLTLYALCACALPAYSQNNPAARGQFPPRFGNTPQAQHHSQTHNRPPVSWGVFIGPQVGIGVYGGYAQVPMYPAPYVGVGPYVPPQQYVRICPQPQILWQTPYETMWHQPPCIIQPVW